VGPGLVPMLTWQGKEQNQRNWNRREKLNSQAQSTYQFKHSVLYIHKAPKYIMSYKTLTHKLTQHPLSLCVCLSLSRYRFLFSSSLCTTMATHSLDEETAKKVLRQVKQTPLILATFLVSLS